MDRSDRAFVAVLIVAVLAAIVLAVGRMKIEGSSHRVEVIVDADDVRRVAAGAPLEQVLSELRRAGATALGVHEMTLKDLRDSGRVAVVPEAMGAWLSAPNSQFAFDLAQAIQAKFPREQVTRAGALVVHTERLPLDQLMDVPLLLRPEDVHAAHTAGMRIVARLGNYPSASPQSIEAAAAAAERAGARLVVFRDDQVLGYRALVDETANAFNRHHLDFGFVEIAKQKGDERLAELLSARLIRVHSITDTDLETIPPGTAVARYARAVRERGIRACYVRLIARPQEDSIAANVRYVAAVVQGIREQGLQIGSPEPLHGPPGWPRQPLPLLVILGVPAGLALLVRRLVPLPPAWVWTLFAGIAVVGVGLGVASSGKAADLGGLAAASIFPSLGLALALQRAEGRAGRPGRRELMQSALSGLLIASAVSFAGALLVVGLYARVPYLQGIGEFFGVKASYGAPLLPALLVVVAKLPGLPAEPLGEWAARTKLRLNKTFGIPISWGGALALALALGAVGLALMRSGNDSAVAPSGAELHMRSALESILIARPRTKEFLLGHPALMLAIALSLRGRRTWLPLVALIAAVGQISLLNTFCHFHIPLYLGLLRTFHGLWIGAVIGAAAILVWWTLFDRHTLAPVREPQEAVSERVQP